MTAPSGSYDPLTYWTAAGTNPAHREHESHYRRTAVFARQEEQLLATLSGLEFGSVLEIGCGWGRITNLLAPTVSGAYWAIDISRARLMSAKVKAPNVTYRRAGLGEFKAPKGATFDLVLAVEVLMHVPPADIGAVVDKLCALSSRYVVSLDWAVPLGDRPIAPWNFLHPYEVLYGKRLRSAERIGLQAVYVAEVGA